MSEEKFVSVLDFMAKHFVDELSEPVPPFIEKFMGEMEKKPKKIIIITNPKRSGGIL
jgi:hypothetical protein